jgi:ABC-type nitrate/sulfonate/bicarbonate transport system permease component
VLRLLSFAAFLASWWIAALLAGSTRLPTPPAVLQVIEHEASSGALFYNVGVTLARVVFAFTLAMTLGVAIGYLMGRVRLANRLGDPWLILLLNLPALVVIVLAYIWAGLTEVAAIAARVRARSMRPLTKWQRSLPSRADDPFATSFCRSSCPISLRPRAPACRWSGRSC